LCCPYCGAQVTVEAEAKPPRFSLVGQSAVNE
jgi:rRNA maturation protein Nop10